MTDETRPDDVLAAEYALGLLEGEELLATRARLAREPEFASLVGFWETRLAPLLDEIAGAEPSPDLLERIMAEIKDSPGGEVIVLQQRVRFWQRATGLAAMGIAAVVALLLLQPIPSNNIPQETEAPMLASIPIADTDLRLAVTYLPDREEMLVSASGLSADGVHDHELWLVPDEGELQSLGVVKPGEEVRVKLAPDIASLIHDGSQMLLTREPIGGKPPDAAAGPVVAEGYFSAT